MKIITLPELGEGIEKATVSNWYFTVGDQVKDGDDVVELVTDKATFNVPATTMGLIKEIYVKNGEEAKIGDKLALIQ